MTKPLNIITFDGGALKGVIAARILSYLDGSAYTSTEPLTIGGTALPAPVTIPSSDGKSANLPSIIPPDKIVADIIPNGLAALFDIVGGTSTGALIACGICIPTISTATPAQLASKTLNGYECLSLYVTNANSSDTVQIFPLESTGNPLTPEQLLITSNAAYGNAALANVIANLYGAPSNSNYSSWEAKFITRNPVYGPVPGTLTTQDVTFSAGTFATYPSECSYLSDAETNIFLATYNVNSAIPGVVTASTSLNLAAVGAPIYSSNIAANTSTNAPAYTTPFGPHLLTKNSQAQILNYIDSNNAPVMNSLSVLQACMMSSAFPMLLPSVPADMQFSNSLSGTSYVNYFIDGGSWADDPSMSILNYCLQNGSQIGNLISIGCGYTPLQSTPPYSTIMTSGAGTLVGPGWLSYNGTAPLLEILETGPAATLQESIQELVADSGGNYFRLNPPIQPPSGDNPYPAWDTSAAAILSWIQQTDTYILGLATQTITDSPYTYWQSIVNAFSS